MGLSLLENPKSTDFPQRERPNSIYKPLKSFILPAASSRKYTTQYADLYFARLAQLKRQIETTAEAVWSDFQLGDEFVRKVDRVLDVRQGELCWVVGTVFMDMTLKPNILDDLSKEEWIVAPPMREKYITAEGNDKIVLEDESGRLQLSGKFLDRYTLCTGCIIAVLGTENSEGTFEVIDIQSAGLPKQPARWSLTEKPDQDMSDRGGSKIAIISGLELDGSSADTLLLDLLVEYLIGDLDDDSEQATISRLLIAGKCMSQSSPIPTRFESENLKQKTTKKFGIDPASYNSTPNTQFDQFLASVLPSLPVTVLPGSTDPVSVSLPQQPLHAAFFPSSRAYMKAPNDNTDTPSWFDCVSNPWEAEIDGWRVLVNGGQPVNDMFRYIDGDDRLKMMEALLNWRNLAPTAPDTLWCYPFQDKDPFLLKTCPHIFVAGDQPRLDTKVIKGEDGQSVRLIAIPSFRRTGLIALVDTDTLEVECVKLELFDNGTSSTSGVNRIGEK